MLFVFEIWNLFLGYLGLILFKYLFLDIEVGIMLVVLGVNGLGKSMFVKMLFGLIDLFVGWVMWLVGCFENIGYLV